MDKPDVSSLLGELTPTTEYAEFLKLWPDIREARERQVKLNAIYKKLSDAKLLSVSYVTFTRFVKKVLEETDGSTTKASPGRTKVESSKPAAGEKTEERKETEPPSSIEKQDKSETIATPAADALKQAQQSSAKNYAKNLRKQH